MGASSPQGDSLLAARRADIHEAILEVTYCLITQKHSFSSDTVQVRTVRPDKRPRLVRGPKWASPRPACPPSNDSIADVTRAGTKA